MLERDRQEGEEILKAEHLNSFILLGFKWKLKNKLEHICVPGGTWSLVTALWTVAKAGPLRSIAYGALVPSSGEFLETVVWFLSFHLKEVH